MGSARSSIVPTGADQGPAQITVSAQAISLAPVLIPRTVPPAVINPSSGVFSRMTAPRRRAALA